MSIAMECLNVVVLRRSVEARYPGGVAQYRADCPNETYQEDEHLTRVGFMNPWSVRDFVDKLVGRGLMFLDEERQCVDIVVVDMMGGPTTACDWLGFKVDEAGSRCWLSGTEG